MRRTRTQFWRRTVSTLLALLLAMQALPAALAADAAEETEEIAAGTTPEEEGTESGEPQEPADAPEDMPGKPLWQVFQEEVALFQRQMEENADLFVALDGGFGTLDEVMSALATMTFFQDPKPIHLLNRDGLYTPLKAMLETMAERRLASPEVAEAIQLHDDMASLIKALEKANAG